MRFTWSALLLCVAGSAFAQSDRGTITGTVSDPAGAVVSGAKIDAKNTQTGTVYNTVSTPTGNYTVSQLPAGTYQLAVSVPGFKNFVRQGITVEVAQTLRIDVALEVGNASESVTVQADAPLLKTESGDLSHNVNTNFLDELPVFQEATSGAGNIRNPVVLAQLMPGTYMTGQELRISGAPNNTESLRVEGQEAANSGIPAIPNQSQQGVDMIQEVSVQTSNYAAEYGQAGGGVINMTMKSGTNQFHGTVYDYFVNEAFNAGIPYTDNPAGNPRPRERRNDYGFTIGGPVWIPHVYNGHDKTFFFFNWEQYRETDVYNTLQETVPTPAYRQGNFQSAIIGSAIGMDPLGRPIFAGEIYDPNTTRTANGQTIRDPYPNNSIPQSSFDPIAVKIQNLIPQPQGPFANALVNNFVPTFSGTQIESIPAVKIDQLTGSKGHLSFYWTRKWLSQPTSTTFGLADGLPDPITAGIGSFIRSHTIRLNYDYTLTPTTLLHFGAGYFDTDFYVPSVTSNGSITHYNAAEQLGLQGAIVNQFFPAISGLTALNGTGGMKNMGSASNTHQWTQRPTFNTSLTKVRDNHTYKFGAELRIEGYPVENLSNTTGSYGFSAAQTSLPYLQGQTLTGGQTPGFAYASFLLGDVNQVSIANPVFPKLGKHQLGIYAQDSWKVTRKFTLDYGLRYDFQTYLREQYGRAPYFSPTTPNPATGNIPGAAIFDGSGPGHCNCNLAKNYPWGFGPRLGIAYQITPKTVFRGGFGIVYASSEANNGAATTLGGSSNTVLAPSFGAAVTTLSAGIPRSFDPAPWPNYNPGQYNVTGTPVPYGTDWLDPNAGRPPRQYQWSAGFQRQILPNLALEAEYVGNRGIWWESLGLINLNAINPAALAARGININSPADQQLLTSALNSPIAIARGFNTPPYPNFPLTQTVAQSLRPFPQYTTVNTLFDPLGDTWYNSLQVKATKRLSHGLQFNSTFTWSKTLTIGTERDPNPGSTGNAVYNNIFDRNTNKYLSIYDQPFQWTLSASYLTPRLHTNRVLSWLARDWSYGTFLTYRSGLPLQVPFANNNLASLIFDGIAGNAAATGTFANRVPGVPLYTADINCHCYDPNKTFILNPAAWTDPPAGQFGTSAAYYSDYRKQRRPSESMSIGRTWRIKERASFNLRMELYNVFNRPVFNDPSNLNAKAPQTRLPNGNASSGFGYINTTTTVGGAGVAGIVGVPGERQGLLVGRFTF
ncbi:MAG TPA: carboxypeptidase regulatory-like domain-containing protein [Bryobacteraceae bacterium]|nr:carboxypeptidase regulatory-like domain-containing protein [Bryobacteraceae bacterium]